MNWSSTCYLYVVFMAICVINTKQTIWHCRNITRFQSLILSDFLVILSSTEETNFQRNLNNITGFSHGMFVIRHIIFCFSFLRQYFTSFLRKSSLLLSLFWEISYLQWHKNCNLLISLRILIGYFVTISKSFCHVCFTIIMRSTGKLSVLPFP